MAFGQLEQGDAPQHLSEINVTPLVDVMLVLLIIFIVTAPLLTHHVKLNLPKAEAQVSKVEDPIVISMTREGQVYWNEAFIAASELQIRFQELVMGGADPTVELRADGKVQYQQVVHLMALIQKAGVTKLSIVTEPGDTDIPPVED
jgi:biopolymer transport protein ExbD